MAEQNEDVVVLATQPLVTEARLDRLFENGTPNSGFFVRNHFGIPRLDAATWQLTVSGAVERPRQVTLAELRPLP